MSNKTDCIEKFPDESAEDQQKFEMQEMTAKANIVVLGFPMSTGVTDAIPLPLVGAPLLIAQQVVMMGTINAVCHITAGEKPSNRAPWLLSVSAARRSPGKRSLQAL